MGHDIYAFRQNDGDSNEDKEIAYLRRNASDPMGNTLYRVLGEALNGGWSGTGEDRKFSRSELQQALKILRIHGDDPNFEPESTFLHDCLKASDGDVWIQFL